MTRIIEPEMKAAGNRKNRVKIDGYTNYYYTTHAIVEARLLCILN